MKISFELSDRDIRYFRDRLRGARRNASELEEETIAQSAEDLVAEALEASPPEFVLDRLRRLQQMIAMIHDEEWRLEGRDRARIVDALAYFVDPDDLIPDRVPGVGYLDDAIMVELIVQELRHDIKAYEDFCEFRKAHGRTADPKKIEARRSSLVSRMRRRRMRQREAPGSGKMKSPLRW